MFNSKPAAGSGPAFDGLARQFEERPFIGQGLQALAAVAVLASARFVPYNTIFGFVSCGGEEGTCQRIMLAWTRPLRPSASR